MKRIGILGSTGSIGQNALRVIDHLPEALSVSVLAAKSSIDLLEKQARRFHPEVVAVWDKSKARELQQRLPHIPVLGGEEGIIEAACHGSTDLLLSAACGFEGVLPTLRAIEAKKSIALANKEALVAAGPLVIQKVQENGVDLIPVDSEHTAIFQCLKGEKIKEVKRIILTASGGPFRRLSIDDLASIDVEKALMHPNYAMGAKVSIDSSTLMNKGLEMIETHFFYGTPIEDIEVVIHPEQVLHSMVEFVDGSIMAQMGEPDMLIPIQVALTHPDRHPGILSSFDFTKYGALHFSKPDTERFRCLDLSYSALREGGTMPCFMNAANEILVERFLQKQIGWLDIGHKLETLMNRYESTRLEGYDALSEVDIEARQLARNI